jgi:hypothetical protein
MKNAILLPLLFVVSLFTISFTIVGGEENTPSDRTFADLTDLEKKEAVTHMLSTGDCEWEGIKLHGKVQFVTSFPDIKIQYVTSFPDIKVKFVDSFPDDCGEWQEVSSFPDFKVQVVTSFPDIKVQKVDSFPGMN